MADMKVPPWPWWMAPARLVGRYRPALLAAARADAIALSALPRVVVSVGLPLAVIALAGFVSVLHATTVLDHVAPHVSWLRFQIDDVWTEAPAFMLGAIAIGVFSPALGAFMVAVFGIMDLAAAAIQPYELAPLPGALAARLVAIWLLWLLIVEIPVLGRLLAGSIRAFARNRLAMALISGLVTGGFTLFWAAGAAILVRPIFEWSTLPSGGRAEAYLPMQTGGFVFAVAAAAIALAVALLRRPGGLLNPGAPPSGPIEEPMRPAGPVASAVRRLVFSALLVVGLGGMITVPLDAAVLFAALAGAGPAARWIGARNPFGSLVDRLPSIVRVAVAIPLVYGVSFLLIHAEWLTAVSEFFSVIVVFAVGLFVIELVTARPERSQGGPSKPHTAVVGAAIALALLALRAIAPMPVFADNGTSLIDLWPLFDLAVFAGMATPFVIWAGNKYRPPTQPWYKGDPRGWPQIAPQPTNRSGKRRSGRSGGSSRTGPSEAAVARITGCDWERFDGASKGRRQAARCGPFGCSHRTGAPRHHGRGAHAGVR